MGYVLNPPPTHVGLTNLRSRLWLFALKATLPAFASLIYISSSSDVYAAIQQPAEYLDIQESDFLAFMPCPELPGLDIFGGSVLCDADLDEKSKPVIVKLEGIDQSTLLVDESKLTLILEALDAAGVDNNILLPHEASLKVQPTAFINKELASYEIAGVVTCVCYVIIAICSAVKCP